MSLPKRLLSLFRAAAPCWALGASAIYAQLFTWNDPGGGLFSDASNWTPAGGPPNSSAESPVFGLATATYDVQFNASFTNNVLNFNSGTVSFSSVGGQKTYTFAGNAGLAGGNLTLGPAAGTAMTLNVGAISVVGGNHQLNVYNGSDFTTVTLQLGSSSGDGFVSVSGSGSTLHTTATTVQLIGRLGHSGDLSFDSGAAGTIDGSIGIVQTSSANTLGSLELFTGSTLTALSSVHVADDDGAGQAGTILVTSAGSVFTQSGFNVLVVGGSTDSKGAVHVNSGGVFNTGIATITVNALGTLDLNGGTFNANGTLNLSGGQVSVTSGALNAAAHVLATNAEIDLSGGTINFNSTFAPSSTTINVSGGVLNLPATQTLTGGTLALSGTGTTNLGPGRTLNVVSNGTLSSSIDLHTNGGTIVLTDSNLRMSTKLLSVVGTVQFNDTGGLANTADVGVDGDGTITLDGSNAKLTTTSTSFFNIDVGFHGNHGTLALTNGAGVDNGGGMQIGSSLTDGTSGVVSVGSGCRMTLGAGLRIAGQSGQTTGLLTVSGINSTFDGGGTCLIGAGSLSAATFSVTSAGSASIGATLTINKTGQLLINAGQFLADGSVIINGGVLHRTGGSFSQGIATIFEISNDGTAIFDNGIHISSNSQVFHLFDGHLNFDTGVRLGTGTGSIVNTGSITADGANALLFIGVSGGATVGFGSNGRGTLELRNSATGTILGSTRVGMNSSVGSLLVNSNAVGHFASVLVGVTGGAGTFNVLSGGSVTLGNLSVGLDGTGTMLVSGATVTQNGTASLTVGGATGAGSLTIQSATFTSGSGFISVNSTGVLLINAGTLVANGNMVERSGNVTIAGALNNWNGQLDLTDQDRIIDYSGATPFATVVNQIKNGYAAGAWNGNGIASSSAALVAADSSNVHKTALGYAEASAIGVTTFDGQTVDATTLLVRYTLCGDANIDGTVNALDFTALAINFNKSGKFWINGDFNYDGVVNALDFNAIATNFGVTLPSAPVSGPGSLVPDPTALLPLAAAMFLRRGRGASGNPRKKEPRSPEAIGVLV